MNWSKRKSFLVPAEFESRNRVESLKQLINEKCMSLKDAAYKTVVQNVGSDRVKKIIEMRLEMRCLDQRFINYIFCGQSRLRL